MADQWNSDLPWAPHQRGLAQWSASRWGWRSGDPDWPSALALIVAAEDEGHTALAWNDAPAVYRRRFSGGPLPDFTLPIPSQWPSALFSEGWLRLTSTPRGPLVQTAKNAALQTRLFRALQGRAGDFLPGSTQDDAVARAGKARLLVLAGGPGTGKTTTLQKVVAAWKQTNDDLRVVVAAPTGRAAARAKQAFGTDQGGPECLTLHRLLGLRPGLGQSWHGPHRPLPFDLVIVDEASMVDLRTAVALVEALPPEAALVLVGDPGQLPSVEAGSVLADILESPVFAGSVVTLSVRYRLQKESLALASVFDLLEHPVGDPEAAADALERWGDGTSRDFRWVITEGEGLGPALAAWGSPRGLGLANLGERILLSPVHQGPVGTETLGHALDRQLGRPPGTVDHGTPWMIVRNLNHLSLANGDRGLVIRADHQLWFVTPEEPDRRIPFALVREDGTQAWAITVHKSQGSEYDRVVVVLPSEPTQGLVRELVYTGLTRAKRGAILVASRASVVRALGQGTDRASGFGWSDDQPRD